MEDNQIVGYWRRMDESVPAMGRTVIVCGDDIMQMCNTMMNEGRPAFYEVVHETLLGYFDDGFVTHWTYIELPDGEGTFT